MAAVSTSESLPVISGEPEVRDDCNDREALLRDFVRTLDEDTMARTYRDGDGLLVLPRLLPQPLIDEMAIEGRLLLEQHVVRKRVPFLRRAGAVGHSKIVSHAPAMHALHLSPSLMAMFERVTGVPLEHRDPNEAHQSALYTYTKPGDWMDWHYDECGCPPNDSFSTIIGVIDNSSSRLEVETRRDHPGGVLPLRKSIHTEPGTFAFFCGTRAYHRVTSLGEGEERVTFAFTYIRKGKKTSGIYDLRMRLGNALVYFGFGAR